MSLLRLIEIEKRLEALEAGLKEMKVPAIEPDNTVDVADLLHSIEELERRFADHVKRLDELEMKINLARPGKKVMR